MLLHMVSKAREQHSLQFCISLNPLETLERSFVNNLLDMDEEPFVDWEVTKISSWLHENGLPLSVCDIFEGNLYVLIAGI